MQIRPLAFDNPRETEAFYLAIREAAIYENPDRPMWSKSEMISHLTEPVGEAAETYAAFDDDGERLLGGSIIFYPLLDNLSMAFVEVFVPPAERRRGIGSRLLDDAVDRVRGEGRSIVLSETYYAFERREDHPYRRFAEKHGFSLASTEVSRRLDLPVADGQLQAWIDESAPHHEGYRIESYVNGQVPDELVPSLCHVINQLAVDAPTGDIEFEAEGMTPELWRQRRDRDRKQGLTTYQTVAIAPDGDVVAATVIGVPADDPDKAHQWATIVLREHRGHRLGLAIKARNLRELQGAHPDRTSVHTTNAEVNAQMVGINERMGFKPVELMGSFQRKLA